MNKKAFSLIELVIAIAILAVLSAVLVPTLIQYVERTRQDKDFNTMSTVTDAVTIALADENVYNEVLEYITYNNFSCYIDKNNEAACSKYRKDTSAGTTNASYTFTDGAREEDETLYWAAGSMPGITITFQPENNGKTSKMSLQNAIVNKYIATGTTPNHAMNLDTVQYVDRDSVERATYVYGDKYIHHGFHVWEGLTLTEMTDDGEHHYLYDKVRATIGDSVELGSSCYRNSEYTIFIHIETTQRDMTMKNAIQVYGQWNGTNLE